MNRSALRWLNPVAVLMGTLIAVSIQSSVFSSYPLLYLQPDVVLILTIWCALRRGWTEGGILVLVTSHIQELHSGSFHGLFLCLNMATYLAIRALSKFLLIRSLVQFVIATLFISIIWRFALLGLVALIGLGEHHWRHTVTLALPSAVMQGAVSVWIYRLLEKLDLLTLSGDNSQRLGDDDPIGEDA